MSRKVSALFVLALAACVTPEGAKMEYDEVAIQDAAARQEMYQKGLTLLERDRRNLQLVKTSSCNGMEINIYAPRRMDLYQITAPTTEKKGDYSYNVYFLNEGIPTSDFVDLDILGTDWSIVGPKGEDLFSPQIGLSHIETNKFPTLSKAAAWRGYPKAIGYGSLQEVFAIYTDADSLYPGRYTISLSTPSIDYADGSSCDMGTVSFHSELYGESYRPSGAGR